MEKVIVKRTKMDDLATYGVLIYQGKTICKTMELPWKYNKRGVSCIPEGEYDCVKRVTEKRGHHYHIKNVPGRSLILIHHGNYTTDIKGCILVGTKYLDINGDNIDDIIESKKTMKIINEILPDQFKIEIVNGN